MASEKTSDRASASGRFVTVNAAKAERATTVKFGNVTIKGSRPSREVIKTNVERSSKALERVSKKLMSPGINLRPKRDVPRFFAADGEYGVFIRRLNGVTERGRLVDGIFQVID